MFRLDGKTAAVTGAGSGIGRAIAQAFAGAGAFVYLLDIDAAAATEAAHAITATGGHAAALGCDVADAVQVQATFASITQQRRLDILVNNAGVSHIGNLENTTEADFDRLFRVNVKGVYCGMQAVVGHMKAHGGGVILNLASVAASVGLADRFGYSMTKGAVRTMTFSVARDYIGDGIRCNCISPGRVHTPFVDGYLQRHYPGREQEMYDRLARTQPIGRMGEPDEIAALALYLCSDAAAFITGSDYPIDGGFLHLHG
jgi:NAD(P)-dependent dehydrogenase (short-subunit alcohol dehydrogenase family)